jgi:hypothetical protein
VTPRTFLAVGLAKVLVVALLGGCGASALDRTERAYGALHAVQAEAVARFETKTRETVRERCSDVPTAELDACGLDVAGGFAEEEAGLDLSADALDTAGREIAAWAAQGKPSPNLCARVAAAVTAVGHALELVSALGVDLAALGLPAWTCPEVE